MLSWSERRVHRRAAYCNYMASEQRFALRERWVHDWGERHGREPHCLVCGVEWALCDDVHRRTSERPGSEALETLIPLCRSCHGAVHHILESDRSWRRLGRTQATDLVVATLRRRAYRRGVGERIRKLASV